MRLKIVTGVKSFSKPEQPQPKKSKFLSAFSKPEQPQPKKSKFLSAMYWAAEINQTTSNGSNVFDTADGFAGVWHLGQTDGSRVPDATVNGIDGTAEMTTATSGVIGEAQMFNGISSLIRASGPEADKLNFPEDSDFSVSAWVKTAVIDTFFYAIVFKSNKQYGLQIRPYSKWEFFNFIDNSRWEMSQAPVGDTSWHALTGVRNGNKQYLFVDGVCVDSSIITIQAVIPREYTMPFEIGHCPDGGYSPDRYFNGIIDEVRVAKIAFSKDWVKLCYMNQKAQDALVEW
jgi:hypothetical protein